MLHKLDEADLQYLSGLVPPERFLSGEAISDDYSHDELGGISCRPDAVIRVLKTVGLIRIPIGDVGAAIGGDGKIDDNLAVDLAQQRAVHRAAMLCPDRQLVDCHLPLHRYHQSHLDAHGALVPEKRHRHGAAHAGFVPYQNQVFR